MTEIVLGLVGALTGSGVMTVVLAILQRKWQQKDKLDEIKKSLDAHCQADDERYIKQCRTRILRFSDEVIRGTHHTEEHFNDVLDDITEYTRYCEEHKDYKNAKAVLAIENVQQAYRWCAENDAFLRKSENV